MEMGPASLGDERPDPRSKETAPLNADIQVEVLGLYDCGAYVKLWSTVSRAVVWPTARDYRQAAFTAEPKNVRRRPKTSRHARVSEEGL